MKKPLAYYNEFDPRAAAWLRELIKEGFIAYGEVDERSVWDVEPLDVLGYTQCHFFAGIGGWSYALRLAGWSDCREVWTGSAPCQPFSAAGKGAGFADERHLWPAWFHLIRECAPPVIFGEQVANALTWFDLVSADLENQAYAVGGAIVGAHSVGAPHIRQRLYWVADCTSERLDTNISEQQSEALHRAGQEQSERRCAIGELGDSGRSGTGRHAGTIPSAQTQCGGEGIGKGDRCERTESASPTIDVGHSGGERLEGRSVPGSGRENERATWTPSDVVWCRDGKWRPVEPGTFPLAHGVPHRVGLLRGYGNAIVPQVAAAFISAYADSTESDR